MNPILSCDFNIDDILFQLTADRVPDVSDAWLVQLAESVAAR